MVLISGINTKKGAYSSMTGPDATAYPYNGGRNRGVLSVIGQGAFGPNSASREAAALINGWRGEPGGIDVVTFSGGAGAFIEAVANGLVNTSNIVSTTYLSPGVFHLPLIHVGDTAAFRGSGLFDFFTTADVRFMNGANLQKTGPNGHSFALEYGSSVVQQRLYNVGAMAGGFCGSRLTNSTTILPAPQQPASTTSQFSWNPHYLDFAVFLLWQASFGGMIP